MNGERRRESFIVTLPRRALSCEWIVLQRLEVEESNSCCAKMEIQRRVENMKMVIAE